MQDNLHHKCYSYVFRKVSEIFVENLLSLQNSPILGKLQNKISIVVILYYWVPQVKKNVEQNVAETLL